MVEQIRPSDHADKARRIIHESTHDEHGEFPLELLEDRELAEYHASMVESNAHATLALVQAQDTANLIAYLSSPRVLAEDIELVRAMVRDRLGVRDE